MCDAEHLRAHYKAYAIEEALSEWQKWKAAVFGTE